MLEYKSLLHQRIHNETNINTFHTKRTRNRKYVCFFSLHMKCFFDLFIYLIQYFNVYDSTNQTLDASTLSVVFVRPRVFVPYIVDKQPMGSFDASHQELQNGIICFSTWTYQREKNDRFNNFWSLEKVLKYFLSLTSPNRKTNYTVL